MAKRFGFLVAAAALSLCEQAAADTFIYTARLSAPARVQGAVTASGITWSCQGIGCTTTGPWLSPGVGACRALSQQVGPIAAYGRPGAQLDAAGLAQCNTVVMLTPAQRLALITATPLNPAIVNRARNSASNQREATPPPSHASGPPWTVRTTTLTMTGTGALTAGSVAPPPAFSPTTVRTMTLTMTGTGALTTGTIAPPPPFSPTTVRTRTLTMTGTGALTPSH